MSNLASMTVRQLRVELEKARRWQNATLEAEILRLIAQKTAHGDAS